MFRQRVCIRTVVDKQRQLNLLLQQFAQRNVPPTEVRGVCPVAIRGQQTQNADSDSPNIGTAAADRCQ